ncbi:MAG: hypothetical protein ACREYD_03350 [Casimicrobiaceae bacterium]
MYDSNGNRLSANVNGAPATYSYTPNSNRLTGVAGLYTNSYDAAGNLVSDGSLTHTTVWVRRPRASPLDRGCRRARHGQE